ncbi:uncharacterized protein BJ212DRAFT_1299611 [Suillus subaureus]|uniref:Uncharacterized protein n=1 Tax=Suillus subaureus TaxID=48587 RepID=A0A9P7EBQ6_9AGAM|nr:uncharacterized protein BJ212DRAFT_1299611 [Suillus subaureus]KAG1816307.1 hypothetical protein BJ212DRAFT_1299611 [Suillus subaureus]
MSSDSESLSLSPPRKHKKLSYSTGSSSLLESRKHKKLSDSGSLSQSSKHRNSTDKLLQVVQTKHSKKIKQQKVTCVLNLFGLPSVTFHTGLQHDCGGKISSDLTEDVIECHLHLYNGILDFVLSLCDELDTISTDRLSKIISVIMKGMSDAWSTAFSSVKHKGLKYVLLNMHSKNNALNPPIPEVKDKSIDPEDGMEKLQSGKIKMAAMSWPTGFYKHGIYNLQNKTKGLFRNHVIARFYAHLYIVHIITYFTLSQAQNWTSEIGTMNLKELFWSIINMLDDDEDPWVKDTMACHIRVKTKVLTKKPENEDNDNEENDIADIKAQRLARCSAMKTKVAGAKQLAGTNTSLTTGPWPQMLLSEDKESADDCNPVPPARKKPAAPLPPKTKCTQLVESDNDIEDVEAPPVKKKMVPPLKAKHPQLVESDDNTEDVKAPPIKKTMDVDNVKAPPVKKKPVPTLSLPMLKHVQPVKAPEELAYKAPPNKKTPVPSRPESPLPKLTEDESSSALFEPKPLPKKKGKKAAKVQCVPMKRNPTRQKQPNGF